MNNKAIEFNDFSFIYDSEENQTPVLSNINFTLNEGEKLIIAGSSGSGKSTLAYAMNGIIPWRLKGSSKGDVKIFGKSVWDLQFSEISKMVGLVKQNPLEQLTTFTVRDEISFGLENLKIKGNIIDEKVEEISELMGINHLLDRDINQLSGGQKQLTILSSFLAMDPKILILDEPIAFLDQKSESLLLNKLFDLTSNQELKLTLVIIEHRLSRVMNLADKIIVLNDEGKIVLNGNLSQTFLTNFDQLKSCNIRVPWILNLFNDFKNLNPLNGDLYNPIDYQSLLEILPNLQNKHLRTLYDILMKNEIQPEMLEKYDTYRSIIGFDDLYVEKLKQKGINPKKSRKKSDIILETKNLTFSYPNINETAINDLTIKIHQGDFIGLVGPNGSGKTTLLYLLAGLYSPTKGKILYKSQNLEDINQYEYLRNVGFIFQNPETMIFKTTIIDEILYAPKNFGIINDIQNDYTNKLIDLIGVSNPNRNPFKLSWGQKRRLNLSSIFVYNPDIILLDEPFIGQDQKTIDSLVETLYIENIRGKTIIISSHDYHLLLKYTQRIIELNDDGTLRSYTDKRNYFKEHSNLGPIMLVDEIEKELKRR
ncbi:MAG: ABC transporter ATP-binding protein [Candidatus Lokiarchaeota archaeon]|nr:ABC transporter ATP-binding protein [Candidatus Lokiarchaeota archaeon]